jgi:DNA helicase-2/ATP-dependent DNA helicase PcrA
MGILDGLNTEQLMAVIHKDGPQLVVAGAGTGKTQVITRRIAYLIAEGRAKPSQILALTFTEKAAREMEERMHELLGWQSFEVPIMTFHAFGAELLGRYASHIGRSVRGGLLNDTQKTLLLKQHLDEINLEYYGPQADIFEFLEGIVSYIGQLQNASINADDYQQYVDGLRIDSHDMHISEIEEQNDLAKLYKLYEVIKGDIGAYDYNDQINLPLKILRTRPNLAKRLSAEFKYVLIDEYQDTNAVQDELLRIIVGSDGNIFAVGDDDQAIYGFRGAEINNILDFRDHFDIAEATVLVQNYRSGQEILDAAYSLIQNNNPLRLEAKLGINKRLLGQHNQSHVSFVGYQTPSSELDGILAGIDERIASGEAPDSIAVLAATHAPLRSLAKAMARRGLPYALSTSVSIFDQPELLALWYLIQWLAIRANDEAVSHILLGPFVAWDSESVRSVIEIGREELITIEQVLRESKSDKFVELINRIDKWRKWAEELTVSQLTFKLVFHTGLAERWQALAADSPRMVRVFEDLQRLLEHMQDYETVALSPALTEYLDSYPKPPTLQVIEPIGDAKGVQLLTVHAAKGLEFDTVYIIACTQRSWSIGRGFGRKVPDPLTMSQTLPPEHEFRRLMYVAVTRAKKTLILSAGVSNSNGNKQALSPFVGEVMGDKMPELSSVSSLSKQMKPNELMQKLQRFYPLQTTYTSNRLPFESQEGWLDLNVTALGAYEYCPFEFYLQYVLMISQPVGPQLGFGSLLHRMFELYYKGRLTDRPTSLNELEKTLDEVWSNRGYIDSKSAKTDKQLALQTLRYFYEREEYTRRKIIGSEVPIRFDINEAKLRLRGKIDALFEGDDGIEIHDFKTGRTQTDPEKLDKSAKTNFQLRTYALGLEQLRGMKPALVVLDYVVTQIRGASILSETILQNHRAKLVDMADNIRARNFAPNPSPLHQCAAIRFYGTGEQEEIDDIANHATKEAK